MKIVPPGLPTPFILLVGIRWTEGELQCPMFYPLLYCRWWLTTACTSPPPPSFSYDKRESYSTLFHVPTPLLYRWWWTWTTASHQTRRRRRPAASASTTRQATTYQPLEYNAAGCHKKSGAARVLPPQFVFATLTPLVL